MDTGYINVCFIEYFSNNGKQVTAISLTDIMQSSKYNSLTIRFQISQYDCTSLQMMIHEFVGLIIFENKLM